MRKAARLRSRVCAVTGAAALAGLVNLEQLVLCRNRVVDITPLVANPGLGTGDLLYLGGNPLSQESIDTHVPALVARGVIVYL